MFTQRSGRILWSTVPAFIAKGKLHWPPIHSLMLMFDQLHCRPMFSVLPGHSWQYTGMKNILARLLTQLMPCCVLHFVGKKAMFYVYLIVFANTFQIQTTHQIQICALLWFSLQIHQNSCIEIQIHIWTQPCLAVTTTFVCSEQRVD